MNALTLQVLELGVGLASVFGGTFDAIDDEHVDLLLSWIEPQTELFPRRCED